MKKIDVLMLDLKSYYPSPPYQLGLLAAYANTEEDVREQITFTFSEHPRTQPEADIARAILDAGADMVAASHYAWNQHKLLKVLRLLAASGEDLPWIVLGGPNASGKIGAEVFEKYPMVSALVDGEGEPAFRDICLALTDSPTRNPFAEARNCVLRGEDGSIVQGDMGHRIQFLDDIPSPYMTGLLPTRPGPIFYETNRGCPYRCAFCYWGQGNSKIYRMSLERIEEEMTFFAERKVSSFWLADANFGIFPDDAKIAQLMVEINNRHGNPFSFVGVNWAKNSSDRILEIAGTFRRGGMQTATTLALQSVTPEAETASKRYAMPPRPFINLIASAHRQDIDTYTDLIWGLPGEGVDEFIRGIDAVVSSGIPSIKIH
ncbi:MAG: radical SAM protein, partial [Verrucomicrobiota bacterium]